MVWSTQTLEENDLMPDSPQIIELDGKQHGLIKLFNEGTIQRQDLADLTRKSNLMPRRLAEVRKLIGYIGKLSNTLMLFYLSFSIDESSF